MIFNFFFSIIGSAVSSVFTLLGSLPFIGAAVTDYSLKFIGWGCYICGTDTVSMLFVSLASWGIIFGLLGVLKFIKTYIPIS